MRHPCKNKPTESIAILLAIASIATGAAICCGDSRLRLLALNTLWLAGAVAVVAIPIGTLFAWALARTDMPMRRTLSLLLATMLFLPLTVQAAAWRSGFGPQGLFTISTNGQWAVGQTVWLDGLGGAICVHAAAAVPWVVLIVGLSFRLIRPELEEEAFLDGSVWDVFFKVTLPRSAAAILVATVSVLIRTAGEMTVTDLFAVRTFAEEIYTESVLGEPVSHLVVTSLSTTLVCGGLFTLAVVACRRIAPRQRPATVRPQVIFRLGRWRGPITLVVTTSLLSLVGIPIAGLVSQAGMVVSQSSSLRLRHVSFTKFMEVILAMPHIVSRDAFWSLLIAACAATSATILGVTLAWQARRGDWRSAPAILAVALGLTVPGPMIGAAIIFLFNRTDHPLLVSLYDHSILLPWIAQTIHSLPLAVLIPWYALRSVSTDTLRIAATDGAGPVTRLLRIAAASRVSALALTWLVAFAVAMGELASTALVVPPGITTLTSRIFEWLHYGANDQVAGVCLWMTALFFLLGCGGFRLASKIRSSAR